MESNPGNETSIEKKKFVRELLQEIYNLQLLFIQKMYPRPDCTEQYDIAVQKLKDSIAVDGFVPE